MKYKKILSRLLAAILLGLLALVIIFPPKPILLVKMLNHGHGFKLENLHMLHSILKERYNIIVTSGKHYDVEIDGPFGNQAIKNKHAIKIYFTGEGVPAKTDAYDLSIGFDYLDQQNYLRIPYFHMTTTDKASRLNAQYIRKECQPKKPYFACFLNSNGGSVNGLTGQKFDGVAFRDRLFHRLSLYKRVESGGHHLNNLGFQIRKTDEFLSKCKFVIAVENQTYRGYITEKVFNAYYNGAIPIYYSDLEAAKDINKQAVIFAPDFTSEEALVDYIKQVDNDDELYCKIWNEKLITDPARNYETIKNQLRKKLEILLKRSKN